MRRFLGISLFFGVWLLLLSIPHSRSQIQSDLPPILAFRPTAEAAQIIYASDLDVQVETTLWPLQAPLTADEIATDDDTPKALRAEADKVKALEPIVKAHPQELWLLSLWLQRQVNGLKSNRNAGPLNNSNYPAPPSPLPDNEKLTPRADWEKLIAYARQGSRLDPQNSYFDWYVLYGLLALRRDDEAFAVLQRAAAKSNYHEFEGEITTHRIAALSKLSGPMPSGKQLSMVWSEPFPQYAKMRQTARWLMENAIADRDSGDSTRALQWSWNLVRLGRIARVKSYSAIGSLVAVAVESIGYYPHQPLVGGVRRARPMPGNVLALRADLRSAPYLARQKGQLALALQFEDEWKALGAWRAGTSRYISTLGLSMNLAPMLPPGLLNGLMMVERAQRLVMWSLPLLGVCWLLGLVFARGRSETADTIVAAWSWGTALCVFVLTLLLIGDILGSLLTILPGTGISILSATSLWNSLWYAGASETGVIETSPSWAWGGIAAAMLVLSLWLTYRARRAPRPPFWKQVLHGDDLVKFDLSPLVGLLARLSLWMLGIGLYFGLLVFPHTWEWDSTMTATVGLATLVLGLSLAVLLYSLMLGRLPNREGIVLLWSQNLRRVSATSLTVLTAVYLLCLVGGAPLKARFDQGWQQYLAVGEMGIARKIGKF